LTISCTVGVIADSNSVDKQPPAKNNDKTPPKVSKEGAQPQKLPPIDHTKGPQSTISRDDESGEQVLPCEGIPSYIKVDPPVQEFLTCDVVQILAQPERVQTFKVKPKPDSSVPEENKLGNYPIVEGDEGKGRDLAESEINKLKKLFFSESSYHFAASKRCRFAPNIGLHFIKGEESVEVLLDFPCNIWTFVYKKEEKLEDFDAVREELLNLHNSVFPPPPTETSTESETPTENQSQ